MQEKQGWGRKPSAASFRLPKQHNILYFSALLLLLS